MQSLTPPTPGSTTVQTYSSTPTFAGAAQIDSWSSPYPVLGAHWTGSASIGAPTTSLIEIQMHAVDGPSAGSVIGAWDIAAGSTSASVEFVNSAFPAGTTQMRLSTSPSPYYSSPTSVATSLSISWTVVGSPPCEYGSSKIEPLASIVEVGPAIIDEILGITGSAWALPFVVAHAASVVFLNTLCANDPPAPQTIDEADWYTFPLFDPITVAEHKLLNNFTNSLWFKFCR